MKARGVVLGKLLDQARRADRQPHRWARHEVNQDLKEAVDTFNALALPDMFCGIDVRGMLHLTLVGRGRMLDLEPKQIVSTADFIWAYDPINETYTNLKDRTGEFS